MILSILLLEMKDVESLLKADVKNLRNLYSTLSRIYTNEIFKFWSNIVMLQSLFFLLQGWISIFVSLLQSKSIAYRMIKWHYYGIIAKNFVPFGVIILSYINRVQFIDKWMK